MKYDSVDEDVIELRHYFNTVMKYKWSIAALSLAVTMLAAVVVYSMAPTYRATATLLIEAESAKPLSIEEVYGLDSSQDEFFLTQFEIIKSKGISEQVVDHLELVNSPEFDPDQREQSYLDQAKGWVKQFLPASEPKLITEEKRAELKRQKVTRAFMSRLNVAPIPDTQLVHISFESKSPELAAEAANLVAEQYIESQMESKLDVTQRAASWLNSRLDDLRIKLEKSEAALQDFQEKEGLVDVEGVLGLGAQELNEITAQLLEARKSLKEASSLRSLVRARGADVIALSTLPEVLNHSVIQDVKRAEIDASRNVSEMAQRYGPKHPKLIAARDQLYSVEAKLRTEIRQLIAGIESDYQTALANEKALSEELVAKKQEYQGVARKGSRYSELKREVEVNTQLYNAFLVRFNETNEIANFEAPSARVIDKADAPEIAVKPKKMLILSLVLIVCVMAGVVMSFMAEALNDSIRTAEDVESGLGQSMIGMIPWVPHNKKKGIGLRLFFDSEQYKFAEAIRSLRTSFVLSQLEGASNTVAITSSLPGEGKTTVSENLAFSLAQMENVLLIDADMRRPSLGRRFGLSPSHPGLSNLITGSANLSSCIHHDEQSGLDVIPAGAIPRMPQELLASDRFERLLNKLREKYDRIIIDTAPLQVVSDAQVISRVADSMLYVVKADSSRQKAVEGGIRKLLKVGANLEGVVLNQVDISSRSSNYGEFYGYYGGRYGYASNKNVDGSYELDNIKASKHERIESADIA
ncbi:GumC family protein [Microbulbifer sp. MCCC 1A16149]|uniref:GumC family protein n=1 Tax=Microbulbifer sp. MCCC 1A16149 TaxID=3411322 RepID=UPI003D144708